MDTGTNDPIQNKAAITKTFDLAGHIYIDTPLLAPQRTLSIKDHDRYSLHLTSTLQVLLMRPDIEPVEDSLVALASIAAELYSVMEIAWSVSLAAKNAKVISAQSGDAALGFQPITDFIDEISQQAMKGVDDINNEALRLTKIAVNERRTINAYKRFDSVIKSDIDAQHLNSMLPAMARVEENMNQSTQAFKISIKELTLLLESMDQCMLSAQAIASVSRIVTSSAKEYKDKLLVVADDLDKAAEFIKKKLSDSYVHLDNVKQAALLQKI